jgi:hypothetical protein
MKRIILALGLVVACLTETASAQTITCMKHTTGVLYGVPSRRHPGPGCDPGDELQPVQVTKPPHLYDVNGMDLGVLVDAPLFQSRSDGYGGYPFQRKFKTWLPEYNCFVSFGYKSNEADLGPLIVVGDPIEVMLFSDPGCSGDVYSAAVNKEIARTVYRGGDGKYYLSTGDPITTVDYQSSEDVDGNCTDVPGSDTALPLLQVTLPISDTFEVPLHLGLPPE